jgi:hypothetical protein
MINKKKINSGDKECKWTKIISIGAPNKKKIIMETKKELKEKKKLLECCSIF